jgi:hypothetical protein
MSGDWITCLSISGIAAFERFGEGFELHESCGHRRFAFHRIVSQRVT